MLFYFDVIGEMYILRREDTKRTNMDLFLLTVNLN